MFTWTSVGRLMDVRCSLRSRYLFHMVHISIWDRFQYLEVKFPTYFIKSLYEAQKYQRSSEGRAVVHSTCTQAIEVTYLPVVHPVDYASSSSSTDNQIILHTFSNNGRRWVYYDDSFKLPSIEVASVDQLLGRKGHGTGGGTSLSLFHWNAGSLTCGAPASLSNLYAIPVGFPVQAKWPYSDEMNVIL